MSGILRQAKDQEDLKLFAAREFIHLQERPCRQFPCLPKKTQSDSRLSDWWRPASSRSPALKVRFSFELHSGAPSLPCDRVVSALLHVLQLASKTGSALSGTFVSIMNQCLLVDSDSGLHLRMQMQELMIPQALFSLPLPRCFLPSQGRSRRFSLCQLDESLRNTDQAEDTHAQAKARAMIVYHTCRMEAVRAFWYIELPFPHSDAMPLLRLGKKAMKGLPSSCSRSSQARHFPIASLIAIYAVFRGQRAAPVLSFAK